MDTPANWVALKLSTVSQSLYDVYTPFDCDGGMAARNRGSVVIGCVGQKKRRRLRRGGWK